MRNPVIPYAIIAAIGILAMIIIAYLGVFQRDTIANDDNNDVEMETTDPDEIYQNSCASCHGDDLSGSGNNPDLTEVGSRYDEDEIIEIIIEGKGDMPPGQATAEEAEILSEWLVEEHN